MFQTLFWALHCVLVGFEGILCVSGGYRDIWSHEAYILWKLLLQHGIPVSFQAVFHGALGYFQTSQLQLNCSDFVHFKFGFCWFPLLSSCPPVTKIRTCHSSQNTAVASHSPLKGLGFSAFDFFPLFFLLSTTLAYGAFFFFFLSLQNTRHYFASRLLCFFLYW